MKPTKNAPDRSNSVSSNASSTVHPSLRPGADPVAFSELVHRAAEGDARAIGVIAIGMGPALLACARSVVQHREDAEDLVQDFYELLLTGRAARFPPRPGRGLDWLEGLIRSMARVRREERANDWGLADPDYFRASDFRRRPDP
jgi:DNA-directed RNA polymerase specialized sigma24 family protein